MIFKEFQKSVDISWEDICRDVYARHKRGIKVKKEETLVRNLKHIFQVALEVSNRKGFQAMSMRDLSGAAEMSMGALYGYFSGKDELLEMLQEIGLAVTRKVLAESLIGVAHPVERLRRAVMTHVFLSETMRDWFYFSYMEARHLSEVEKEKAKAAELETESLLAEVIEEGCRQAVFKVGDSRMTAAFIKAMLQDWYVKRWKYAKRGVSVDRFAEAAADAAQALCLADGGGCDHAIRG